MSIKFRIPHEHGAWWTFHSCQVVGIVQALAWKADPWPVLALAAAMEAVFLCGEWLTEAARHVLQPGKSLRSLGAWQGWALSGLAAVLTAAGLLRSWTLNPPLARGLAEALALWGLLACGVLWMRLNLPSRSLRLLMLSAVLLTGPVLLLSSLGFGTLGAKALGFWLCWAWFFAFEILYVHTWLRGTTLPRWRIEAASLPFISQAALLMLLQRWPSVVLLGLFSARVLWRLWQRLDDYKGAQLKDGAYIPRLATAPAQIRQLGWEQVAWSLVLSVAWTWTYLP